MKFEMTGPQFFTVATVYLILGLLFFLYTFVAITFISAGKYKLEIKGGNMTIKSILYNTKISLDKIKIDEVKVTNLEEEPKIISVRTNGIGLPGLKIGWFSGNGKNYKLYLTDKTHVLSIPTKKNYEILFSTTEGERIINLLKESI